MKRRLPLFAAPVERRQFLELVAATAVVAAAGGCNRERGKLLPYSHAPPELVPGNPLSYATVLAMDGYATGVVVEAREGRPIKIEGNPEHPASLGATGPIEQAVLMELYDPRRPRVVGTPEGPGAWRSFLRWAERKSAELDRNRGAGIRFLLEPFGSPLLASLKRRILERWPRATFHFYSPLSGDAAPSAALTAFGRIVDGYYDLRRADVVVSLDADFLGAMPDRLRMAREFATRRDPERDSMNRLYVAEAQLSLTGIMADHRRAVRSAVIQDLALALLAELLSTDSLAKRWAAVSGSALAALRRASKTAAPDADAAWIRAVAADLVRSGGRCAVIAGPRQPAVVHVAAHAMNAILGNVGRTVRYLEPVLEDPFSGPGSLEPLVRAMEAGEVQTLVVGAFDPIYSAPADFEFAERMRKVETTIYHGLYYDQTGAASTWFLPAAHELESWGDARGPDGTVSIQQPLIEPLFGGVTLSEVLVSFLGEGGKDARRIVTDFWRSRRPEIEFDAFWADALRKGVVDGTAASDAPVELAWDRVAAAVTEAAGKGTASGLELDLVPSLAVHDGRFSANGWLLELPDPITKITWDNAATVSPATARALGLETGSIVEIARGERVARAPVAVLPMQADDTICVPLGFGRALAAAPDRNVGFDAYRIRTSDAPWFTSSVEVAKAVGQHEFAIAQRHTNEEGRPLALQSTLARFLQDPTIFEEHRGALPTLYESHRYEGYKWGLSIDLTKCIGCAACVVACEAENNTPVVGKAEVANGREMQWLRIDRYFVEGGGEIDAIHQPVMCVHCEDAPCEYVCPVNATVHSSEGLNQMVYNRCVGTRFCSNNCPYKVRRFNYLAYQKDVDEVEAMRMNPDVTVRSRGVMEKCTYCVQRIERKRIGAEIEGRRVHDGEIVPACAQACPTQTIVFGSLNDPNAEVARLRAERRSYALLHDLGTRPRTMHMARIRNPNPELA